MGERAPWLYTWTESEARRGANEVSSALVNFLSNQNLDSVTKLNLFSDRCKGQNKKQSHPPHADVLILPNAPSLKTIVIYFPVRGHSFLPTNRMFGRLEIDFKNHSTILTKEKY